MSTSEIIDKLASYYHRTRSDLVDPQVSLAWVNTSGWESEIYAYTLTSGKPGQRQAVQRVLRLLTGGRMADAEHEYQILALLNRAGYPVPKVYTLGHKNDGMGYPFIIMQCIQGGSFADRFSSSHPGDPEPLHQFIALFHRLHSLDWRPNVDNPDVFEKREDPFYHFDRVLANYASYLSRFNVSAFEPVMAWLQYQRSRVPCPHSSIVHLDFHHNNILEDADGSLYVIDWTSAEISDYRFDLAWTLTLALAYRGPAGRTAILEAYQDECGQPVPSLDVFEVVAILRRIGSVMISLSAGAEALGMRPETLEVMRGEVEPLTRLCEYMSHLTGLDLPEIKACLVRLS
jgi:aminoglycoside phosphotransferase (APT) family kinase protein